MWMFSDRAFDFAWSMIQANPVLAEALMIGIAGSAPVFAALIADGIRAWISTHPACYRRNAATSRRL